jgi:hypothetical protein
MNKLKLSAMMLLCAFAANAIAASAVGLVQLATGNVTLTRGGAQASKLKTLARIEDGDKIAVGQNSSVVLVLFAGGKRAKVLSGSVVSVVKGALVKLSGPKPEPMKPVSDKFLKVAKGSPIIGGFSIGGFTARGEDVGPKEPSPAGGCRSLTPTLRWKGPIVDADKVIIRITLGDEVVLEEEVAPAVTEFSVPEGVLMAGKRYRWAALAVGGMGLGNMTAADLQPLTASQLKEVAAFEAEAEEAIARDPKSAEPLTLLSIAFRSYGLLEDALEACEKAREISPDDEGLAVEIKALKEVLARK